MESVLVLRFLILLSLISQFFPFGSSIIFNAIVSSDGSEEFKRISDAIASAPSFSNTRFYIRVKAGTYHEHIVVPKEKTFITLIGDDAATTIITDGRSNHKGYSTTESATFTVKGNGFMAESVTFKNSGGPENGQAVAVVDQASRTTYYKCIFDGYQDTLYVKGKFQFYKSCDIYGTVDFIFGNGAAVFQDSNIYARPASSIITVTAQSKQQKDEQQSGFSFQNCMVTASPKDKSYDKMKVYLGRPWRDESTVIFMQSYLDDVVDPSGWLEWGGVSLNGLFYAEFNNTGGGSDTSKRVQWPGFHVLKDQTEAATFTVENFIDGRNWLPETGVPFRPGL